MVGVARGLLVLTLVVAGCSAALGTPTYTETWSTDGSTAGWYTSSGLSVSHNDALDTLDFSVSSLKWGYIWSGSGGVFTGDLTPYLGGTMSFDIYANLPWGIEDDTFGINLNTSTTQWQAYLARPTAGQWVHYEVPLVASSWTQWGAMTTFENALGDVVGTGIDMGSRNGASGHIDNFQLQGPPAIPEPSTCALFAAGVLALLARRRRQVC